MKTSNKAVSKGIGDESIEEKVPARILNLGLDLHYRQVTAGMQEDGGRIKPLGKICYERFVVQKKLAEGWEIHSCYEAGASGYWLHRDLVQWELKTWSWRPSRWTREARSKRAIGVMGCNYVMRWIVIYRARIKRSAW
jgi:hypothetical protein